MYHCIRLFFLALLFANHSWAQDFSHLVTKEPRPDWVNVFDHTSIALPKDPSGSAEYLLSDIQHHLEEANYYHQLAFLIVSETGVENFSQLTFDFQPEYETLQFHELQLIRDGVILDRLADTEIEILRQEKDKAELMYDGERSAHLILKDVRKGDILTYAYSLKGKNPVFKGRVHSFSKLGYTNRMAHCRRRVLWNPADRNLRWHVFGPTDQLSEQPAVSTQNGTLHELTWSADALPKYYFEDNTPNWIPERPWLEYSDYESWTDFGKWAQGLFEVDPELPPELIAICDKLKAEAKSEEELIVLTLRWVQRNIRYLGSFMGAHTHQPYPLKTIFERRFGDCKDKGVLTANMLRYLSFDAAPALVNTSKWDRLLDYFPGHGAFNHLIVHLRWEDEDFWLDPTYTYQGGSLRNLHCTNLSHAFVVREGETDLRKVKPRGLSVSESTVHDEITILNLEGKATLTVTTVNSGSNANSSRSYFAKNSLDSINEEYLEYYQSLFPNTKSLAPVSVTDDLENNTFTIVERYEVEEIWSEQDEEDPDDYRYAYFSGYLLDLRLNSPDEGERKQPYFLSFPQNLKHTIRVNLPIEFDIENSSKTIEDPAFKAQANVTYANRVLDLEYKYRSLTRMVAPDQYDSFRKQLTKLIDEADYSIYHYDEEADDEIEDENTEEESSTIGYFLYGGSLLSGLLIGGITALLLFLFWNPSPRIPTSYEYVGIGGWLILPAIGIILAPFIDLINCTTAFTSLHDMGLYFENEKEVVGWRLYYVSWGLESGFFFFMSVLTLVFFFTKRTAFPYLFIATALFGIILLMLEVFWASKLPDYDDSESPLNEFPKLIIQTMIWGSYMLTSERVKATFTHRRGKPHPAQT